MLVFADHVREADASELCRTIRLRLKRLADFAGGLERHSELVAIFIAAAELAQGIADAEFARYGSDENSTRQRAGAELLVRLAREIGRSWLTNFEGRKEHHPRINELLDVMIGAGRVSPKRAEGYAFYGLYPESYFLAARRSGLGISTCVIGIRSIGLGLAALVAAGLDSDPPLSLRPIGDPFRRSVVPSPELERHVRARIGGDFAIVDEGPGLSGSSFAAVVSWLQGLGVSTDRIHIFPSHMNGPGNEASAGWRTQWSRLARHHVGLDAFIVRSGRLADWLALPIGALEMPLRDFSGGHWRNPIEFGPRDIPPSAQQFERLKFLAVAQGKRWLIKFAGLDDLARKKLADGLALHDAGWSPPVTGFFHGFLVFEWLEAIPLPLADLSRPELIRQIGAYLGWRMRHLPVRNPGATPSELLAMAHRNMSLGLDAASAEIITSRIMRYVATLSPNPIHTDNRLHPWEWLVRNGRLIKTDALDHSSGHDLIGCQDVRWDIAGAVIEHGLAGPEIAELWSAVETAGGKILASEPFSFFLVCYAAFQLGLWSIEVQAIAGPEQGRVKATTRYYANFLRSMASSDALGRIGQRPENGICRRQTCQELSIGGRLSQTSL